MPMQCNLRSKIVRVFVLLLHRDQLVVEVHVHVVAKVPADKGLKPKTKIAMYNKGTSNDSVRNPGAKTI